MTATIAIPIWLVALAALLAAIGLLDRILIPSARWFVRRRVNRVVSQLNQRLDLKIQPFKLTKREVLIDRLNFDGEVMLAVEAHADAEGLPREVVMEEVGRYAREIVPSFNAYIYFRIGYWLARRVAELLYRVRLGSTDKSSLAEIEPGSGVVFVMNHRSNMDYVLVAYLAASRTALSYAVGEWARVWPLQALIKSMGAFFIRRRSRNALYRRVLERYVQMATEAGVVQAVYLEGGLSKDGLLRPPKLGLLGYMVKDFDPQAQRDLVFIPVGINYDRVLEDRSLLRGLDESAEKRKKSFVIGTTLRFIAHNIGQILRGKWFRFGYACVNFGSPVSLRHYLADRNVDLRSLDQEAFREEVDVLGSRLLEEVGSAVPVLPVSLVATVFLQAADKEISELELKARAHALMGQLEAAGAKIYIPRFDQDYAVTVGLRMLTLRHLVVERDGLYSLDSDQRPVLLYYANAIAHYLARSNMTNAETTTETTHERRSLEG